MDHVKLTSTKPNPRICGGCTACCTVYPVAALNKKPGVTCQHVCETGCAIYSTHPKECRTFECLWRSNTLRAIDTDEDRPDKSGVIFGANFDKDLGLVLYAQEFREGSIEKLSPLINKIAQHYLIYLAYCDKNKNVIAGPFNRAKELSGFLEVKFNDRVTELLDSQ